MPRRIPIRPAPGLMLRLAGVAALLLCLPMAAGATVPGQNGRIAFETTPGALPGGLAVVNPDGAGLRFLTVGAQPAWSPDGTRLAFVSSTPAGIHIRSVSFFSLQMGGSPVPMVPVTSGDGVEDTQPAWSPDGLKIAFTRCGGDPADCDIWVVNADGTGPVNLTQDPTGEDTMASWSPDGLKIAFSTTRDGNAEIYVMNADGTGPVRLTDTPEQDLDPDWSPDGTRILFARHDSQGVSQVWVMNADGTSPMMLGAGEQPVFSPDGARIAFVQALDTGRDLWVMAADGTGAVALVATSADESSPSWQPVNPGTNAPPAANAGPDVTFTCDSEETAARLDGGASTDPDSTPGTNDDILMYEWWIDFGLPTEEFLGFGPVLDQLGLPSGTYTITLQVTDSVGQTSTDTVVVILDDQTPPQLTVTISPSVIWPPNHRMVPVHVDAQVFDFCGPASLVLDSVTSNEPENSTGDGNFAPDIKGVDPGTADFKFYVRAERSGNGSGRIYTATYQAADPSGNTTDKSAQVLVPHDRGRKGGQKGNGDPGTPPGHGNGNGNGNGNGHGKGNGNGHGKH